MVAALFLVLMMEITIIVQDVMELLLLKYGQVEVILHLAVRTG